jgi:hypothetical protein
LPRIGPSGAAVTLRQPPGYAPVCRTTVAPGWVEFLAPVVGQLAAVAHAPRDVGRRAAVQGLFAWHCPPPAPAAAGRRRKRRRRVKVECCDL